MELIKFTVNHWSCDYYPETDTFDEWMDDENLNKYFRNDDWCKENKLAVVWGVVDMSIDFCVIAPKDWVEKNCPEIIGSKFERPLEEKVNNLATPFTPDYEHFIGCYFYNADWDWEAKKYGSPHLEHMRSMNDQRVIEGKYETYYDEEQISMLETMLEYQKECE